MTFYVVHKNTGRAAVFFLQGENAGKPVPFEGKDAALEHADRVAGLGFYKRDQLDVSCVLPSDNSYETYKATSSS